MKSGQRPYKVYLRVRSVAGGRRWRSLAGGRRWSLPPPLPPPLARRTSATNSCQVGRDPPRIRSTCAVCDTIVPRKCWKATPTSVLCHGKSSLSSRGRIRHRSTSSWSPTTPGRRSAPTPVWCSRRPRRPPDRLAQRIDGLADYGAPGRPDNWARDPPTRRSRDQQHDDLVSGKCRDGT